MCKVSDKIKFCTCLDDTIDIEELNHYWVLHRYNKDKNLSVMGMPVFPNDLNPLFEINAEIVLHNLNTPEAFDKEIELKRGDRLEAVVCSNTAGNDDRFYYNFKYTGKIWKSIAVDYFDIMSRFDELNMGEIQEISKEINP